MTSLMNAHALIVDDNPDNCHFLEFLLEVNGAIVTATTSATEALLALEEKHFDILVSDIGMPEIDGYMLIRAIREQTYSLNHQIPAIAISAYTGEMYQNTAKAAGFQHYLEKPLDLDEVIALIVQLVQKK